MDLNIRAEIPGDIEAVRAVNTAAFETAAEAGLVDSLRATAQPIVSLVADINGEISGHILFSPARLVDHPEIRIMGLAPMAVLPDQQRTGIGSALVRAGLEACRKLDVDAVIVLGHPVYYPRFGFVPSSRFNIDSDYEVPAEVFMLIELEPGVLSGVTGRAKYHEVFDSLD